VSKIRALFETLQITATQAVFGGFLVGGVLLLCVLPALLVWKAVAG